MSTYNNNIPLSTDDPSQSQSSLLANFQVLDTSNSVNHVAFNDANQGKHKFMQMPEQSSAPTSAANEGALFTKETVALITGLYFRRESDGTQLQLTDIDLTTSSVLSGTQYTFLSPWGLRFTFGLTGSYTKDTSITFTTNFSSTPYLILVTPNDSSNQSFSIYNKSAASFKVDLSVATAITGVYYLAIGPA